METASLRASLALADVSSAFGSLPYLRDTLACSFRFLALILPCAAVLLAIRLLCPVPRPIFRKMLHVIAFGSSAFLVAEAASWQAASLTMVLFAAVVYPLLAMGERIPGFDSLLTQKKPGEIKRSLVLLFVGEAAVVALGWGLLGERAVAVAAILMWGVGDAAAALVGIYFGTHVVHLSIGDGKKTWEGTGAMFAAAFACGMLVLVLFEGLPVAKALCVVVPAAAISAVTELASKDGNDTIWVPLATVAALALLMGAFA